MDKEHKARVVAFVEELADQARERAAQASRLSWALDSALSLYRKSDPATGYRSSEVLGDAGTWDRVTYANRILAAADAAQPGGLSLAAFEEIAEAYGARNVARRT